MYNVIWPTGQDKSRGSQYNPDNNLSFLSFKITYNVYIEACPGSYTGSDLGLM